MFYNRDNRNGNSGRAVYPSTAQPLIQKDGEHIHGACKRCSHAHLVPARTVRHRRLWLERLRLCRFPRLVQTTLLADSAPYDDELWRLALSVVLGPCGQPQFHRLCRAYRGRLSGAVRYRRRVPGLRPQQCRLWCHLWWPSSDSRPRRRALCRRQAGRLRRLCPNQRRLAHPLLRVHDRQGGVRSQGILGVARRAPYPRRGFCQGLCRPSRAHALPPDDAVLLRSSVEPPQGLCQRARHPHHRRPAHLCLARLRRDVGHTRAL